MTYIDCLHIINISNIDIWEDGIMAIDKSLLAGSTGLLILRLLEEGDLYGY